MGDYLARAIEQEDVRSRGTSDGVLLPGSVRLACVGACVRVLVAESLFNHSSNNGRRRRFQSDISICSWAGDVLILGPRRHTYLNVSLGRVYMFVQRTIGSYILKKECSIVMEYADADVVGVVVEAQLCVNGGTALLCGTFTHLVAPPRHLHPSAHHAPPRHLRPSAHHTQEYGRLQGKNLENELQEVFRNHPQFGVFTGSGYVLARPVGFSKGSALKVRDMLFLGGGGG